MHSPITTTYPIPKAYTTTFEFTLNADLLHCFQPSKINIKELERVMGELAKWETETLKTRIK
jgi:hypothetical protein